MDCRVGQSDSLHIRSDPGDPISTRHLSSFAPLHQRFVPPLSCLRSSHTTPNTLHPSSAQKPSVYLFAQHADERERWVCPSVSALLSEPRSHRLVHTLACSLQSSSLVSHVLAAFQLSLNSSGS